MNSVRVLTEKSRFNESNDMKDTHGKFRGDWLNLDEIDADRSNKRVSETKTRSDRPGIELSSTIDQQENRHDDDNYSQMISDFKNIPNHRLDSSPTKVDNFSKQLKNDVNLNHDYNNNNKPTSTNNNNSTNNNIPTNTNNKRKAGSPIKNFINDNNKKFHSINQISKPTLLQFESKSQLDLHYQNWLISQKLSHQEKLIEFMILERRFELESHDRS